MAWAAAQGTFSRTTTGSYSVTGLSFPPKVVFFGVTLRTSDGETANHGIGAGIATGSSNQTAWAISGDRGTDPVDNYGVLYSDACIALLDGAGAVLFLADFTTFTSDGFTINVTVASGTAYVITYYAMGGTDGNFELVNFSSPTSTGVAAVTTTIQPTGCILLSTFLTAASTIQNGIHLGIGAADSTSNRWTNCNTCEEGVGTSDSYGVMLATGVTSIRDGTSTTVVLAADFDSFNATDVSFNWTTVNATARACAVLVWNGVQHNIGTGDTPTGTGTEQTTGLNGTPVGVLFTTHHTQTLGTATNDFSISLGWGTSSSSRACITGTDDDNSSSLRSDCDLDTAAVFKVASGGALAMTHLVEADIDAIAAGSFTLDYPVVAASAYQYGYVTWAGLDAPSGQPFRKRWGGVQHNAYTPSGVF